MRKLRKKIYGCAPAHTIYLGPGRKEFHPKKPRPGIEHYIEEAGRGALAQINDTANIDEGVIANFMAPRFNPDSTLYAPGTFTVFHNGILIQNHVDLRGTIVFVGLPAYEYHDLKQPLFLQHHDHPVSYRNIWIREL